MIDGATFANKPAVACPKCGHPYGFLHTRPRFDVDWDATPPNGQPPERLIWECQFCGYLIVTPTADAQ